MVNDSAAVVVDDERAVADAGASVGQRIGGFRLSGAFAADAPDESRTRDLRLERTAGVGASGGIATTM